MASMRSSPGRTPASLASLPRPMIMNRIRPVWWNVPVTNKAHHAAEEVWRTEAARVIAGLTRLTGDVGLAEELAQDALVAALEQWPRDGMPAQPGRMADHGRQAPRDRPVPAAGTPRREARRTGPARSGVEEQPDPDAIEDDVLRLVFVACHPVLTTQTRVALTLRLLGGLSTDEIARAFLTPEATLGAADLPRQEDPGQGAHSVRGPAPRGAGRTPGGGPGGHLPDLQRGLHRDGGRRLDPAPPVRGGAAAGPPPGGPAPEGARGPRPAGAPGDPGLAPGRPHRRRRRPDPAPRPGPHEMGPGPHHRGPGRAQAGGPGPVRAPGRHRRLPRAGRDRRGDRLGPDRGPLRTARRTGPLAGRRAEPGRGPVDGLRAAGGAGPGRRAHRRPGAGGLPPAAQRPGDLLAKLGRDEEARAEFRKAAELTRNEREKALLLARAGVS